MPDTRPGLKLNKDGVCNACTNYDKKKTIDWSQRWRELEKLCDKYRGSNGNYYDCAIAVSGGKDSHVQVLTLKKKLNMNPLLITVDNYSWTDTGRKNIKNICDTFNCDLVTFTPRLQTLRVLTKKAADRLGQPSWYWDSLLYSIPYRFTMDHGIKMLAYGENVCYEYGGSQGDVETPSALDQIKNDVVKPTNYESWLGDGVTMKDLDMCNFPTYDEMKKAQLDPIYMSYYIPWDSHRHYLIAKQYGFQHVGHEWKREGTIEDYNQVDTIGYDMNQFFKWLKFGHSTATELAARWVRAGMVTRDEAAMLVKEKDDKLDQKLYNDYLDFTHTAIEEFWAVAEKWYNRNIFEKDMYGLWHLKNPIWEQIKKK
jgi:N-acetyl sugar amidotransferase